MNRPCKITTATAATTEILSYNNNNIEAGKENSTSASKILLKALAMAASMPIMSNSNSSAVSLPTSTRKFYKMNM